MRDSVLECKFSMFRNEFLREMEKVILYYHEKHYVKSFIMCELLLSSRWEILLSYTVPMK